MKQNKRAPWNLFDVFLVFFVALAFFSVYFTFVKPVQFSQLIKREAMMKYAEVDIVLPQDLGWIKDSLKPGEAYRNIYGQEEWKILEIEEAFYAGQKWIEVKAKIMVGEFDSGIVRYGKYTLSAGSKIYLLNDRYAIEGRVKGFHVLEEKVLS